MGATYWEHTTPYEDDAEEALRKLQCRVFQESGRDLRSYLPQMIEGMVQAVKSCEEDDPYNLTNLYRDALEQYRQMEPSGIPEEPMAQIELLRQIEAISGDWIGNVLDVTGISEDRQEGEAHRLSTEEMRKMLGTATPTLEEARAGVGRHADEIHRGTAVCFPVYRAGSPVSWFFAGYTAD